MDDLQWRPVESSNIREIAWEDNTLYVTFHKSGTYTYKNVPGSVFIEMCNAESVGRFLNQVIKPNYPEFAKCVDEGSLTH